MRRLLALMRYRRRWLQWLVLLSRRLAGVIGLLRGAFSVVDVLLLLFGRRTRLHNWTVLPSADYLSHRLIDDCSVHAYLRCEERFPERHCSGACPAAPGTLGAVLGAGTLWFLSRAPGTALVTAEVLGATSGDGRDSFEVLGDPFSILELPAISLVALAGKIGT